MWWLWEQLHLLEPSSQLGGIYANKPGYHNSRNANAANNYSVVDSEDKGGPGDKAAAIDWTFPEAHGGDFTRIAKYSKRLIAAGRARDPRMEGWREFYGNDGLSGVEGYDFRYHREVSSDPTHDWHIHLSEDRDQAESFENKEKLLSVLKGEDMAITAAEIAKIAEATAKKVWTLDSVAQAPDAPTPPHEDPDFATNPQWAAKSYLRRTYESVDQGLMNDEVQTAKLDQIVAKLDDGTSIIIEAALLKQVMLDPVVVETYAKAIGDQIIGLRYERTEQ